MEQRDGIDREIKHVNNLQITTLADDRALERARDITPAKERSTQTM